MSLPRTSMTVLRRAAATAPLRRVQVRQASSSQPGHLKDDGDLGGPGGQQPPPANPGGPDALKRNWYFSDRQIPDADTANWRVRLPIGAAAGLVAAGVWYMSTPGAEKTKERTKERATEIAGAAEAQAKALSGSGKSIAKSLEDKESKALGELSGRKGKDGMGGFRAE